MTLAYNNANRQSSASLGGTPVANLYNAQGQRAKKTVGSDDTIFHYDREGHPLAETDPASPVQREYVWLEGQPLYLDSVARRPEQIVDNTDAGFSTVGSWSSATGAADYYGADYRSHAPSGTPLRIPTLIGH